MTYKDKASYDSTPPCMYLCCWVRGQSWHTWMSHITYEWVMSHTRMCHTNVSHTRTRDVTHTHPSRAKTQTSHATLLITASLWWAMSQTRTQRVIHTNESHTNESWHTQEWVMSHTRISHATLAQLLPTRWTNLPSQALLQNVTWLVENETRLIVRNVTLLFI